MTVLFPSEYVGRPKVYDETVAEAGTPNTHDVNTDLGRNGGDGYVFNIGDGDLYVYISDDGTNFNGGVEEGSDEKITILKHQTFGLSGLNIDTIKVDASEDGTAYRVVVV